MDSIVDDATLDTRSISFSDPKGTIRFSLRIDHPGMDNLSPSEREAFQKVVNGFISIVVGIVTDIGNFEKIGLGKAGAFYVLQQGLQRAHTLLTRFSLTKV